MVWLEDRPGLNLAAMTDPAVTASSPLSKLTVLALTEAFEACLDASAWAGLGVELDMPQLGDPESRLQKALCFGDDDYGYQVAMFVSYMDREDPGTLRALASRPKLKAWLEDNAPASAEELGLGQPQASPSLPSSPVSISVSDALEHALQEAEHLLRTSGAASALNRIHSALHDYLHEVSVQADFAMPATASMGALVKIIVSDHPALASMRQRDPHIGVVLDSLAVAVATLDPLRNNASAAHPDQTRLGEAEAVLMVDVVRTLFNYLRARL